MADGPALGWLEVDIKGSPGSRISHEIYAENDITGTWATGTKAIPFVCAAKPGLVSPLIVYLGSDLAKEPPEGAN